MLIITVLLTTACSGLSIAAPFGSTASSIEKAPTTSLSSPLDGNNGISSLSSENNEFRSTNPTECPPRPAARHRLRFEHISLEQGLSQSSVLCILQDSKGFMWFGTEDGLNKYDGYSFTVYRHSPGDPDSLSNNRVRSIYQDREGTIWIGTDGGLNKLDRETERFTSYQNDPNDPHSLSSNYVSLIYEDRTGTLWIGTRGGGLAIFDRETAQFIHYQNNPSDARSLSSNYVSTIYEDRTGTLWVGTSDGGLDRLDRETGQFDHYLFSYYQSDPNDPHSLSHYPITAICEDRAGMLWIGTSGGGLARFDRETEKFSHYLNDLYNPHSLSNNRVLSVYEDQAGTLWVGTYGGGLNRLDRETGQFIRYQADLSDPHSLSDNVVWSFYEDRSGVLWIGTHGGLSKYDQGREKFAHYQADPDDPNSLSNNHVLSIYEDRGGTLWIGTHGGGLNRFDREAAQFTHYQHDPHSPHSLSHNIVWAIYEDQAGEFWIGTWGGGLNRFDRKSERFIHYRHDPSDPSTLSSDDVFSIYEDRAGTLWVGTSGGGLNRFDRKTETFTHYQADPMDPYSLSSNDVFSIYEDQTGALWVGTYGGGLNRFDRETGQFIRYQADISDPHSLSGNLVWSIYEDRAGTLWIGTDGGLNRFDRATEVFTHYRERDGLPNDMIYCILEDNASPDGTRGNLWLSTNDGLSKFDPQAETFRNYDTGDGVQSKQFSGGACHRSSSGEMFFGGINGFNTFYPDTIKDNHYIPPIVLTLLTQGGEEVAADKAVESLEGATFHWPNNFFEFEFAALSYTQPEKNQYAYMLEGFDEDWNYIETRHFGRYTNLPGGTYTLRLKGSNNDGVWNQEGTSVTITIVPPVWETWWFRGIAILVLVGGVIGGYRLRVKSIEARARELENLVQERTREIERRRQELEALYRADAELHRHLRLDQVLQALVDIVVDILEADKSSLMVWDDRRERLVVKVARGFRPESLAQMSFAPDTGTVGYVASTGEPIVVEDARTDPRVVKRATIVDVEGIHSFMQVPIKVGGGVFGVFSADYVRPRAFGEDEQRLFIALAQRAALAIDTAQLYEQSQELAVVQERNRLARDLHDAVTQTLFSAGLIAETLPTIWECDPREGRQLLKELRQLSRGALAEMRTLLLELRPAALVEASLNGLLRQLAEAATGRTGVPVTVTVQGQCELPSEVHVALYRIAQEALNNVVKHAGASQVVVSLHCTPPTPPSPSQGEGMRVELCISDNGCGFDPSTIPPDHLGLGIMGERAQAVGARLEIESQPGRGTRVTVVWEDKC